MKRTLCFFVLIILSFNIYSQNIIDDSYIRSTYTKKNKIKVFYTDSNLSTCCIVKQYKIKRQSCYKYFILNNETIYLNVDTMAKYKGDIIDIFKENLNTPIGIPNGSVDVYLVFIVDSLGNIIDKGFDRSVIINDHQKEFFRVLKLLNGRFEPAMINGKKVSTLFKYYFHSHNFKPIIIPTEPCD